VSSLSELRIIAIDGPGGSGKSTVSRRVAEALGWAHLDTGAFYRAATLAVIEEGVSPDDVSGVIGALSGRNFSQEDGRMLLDGMDVSNQIRTAAVDDAVSAVSAHPEVRAEMVAAQRSWVHSHGGRAVVEGRDIGTVVFPSAELKVFLTADAAERARRRAAEVGAHSTTVSDRLAQRDRYDASRAASPLRSAPDAYLIDTTSMPIENVVEEVLRLHSADGT